MTVKEEIIETIMDAHMKIRQNMSRPFDHFIKEKVNPPDYLLMRLLDQGSGFTMGEVAEQMHISKQHATQMVDRLFAEGYVKREYCPDDRRLIRITITNTGKKLLTNCNNMFQRLMEERLAGESQEELQKLKDAIDVIIDFLSKNKSEIFTETINKMLTNTTNQFVEKIGGPNEKKDRKNT